jgi:organic hydroperoxide reductase OsmC/OhrA
MHPLPHQYDVTVTANEGQAEITSPRLNPLLSAPPLEFDGPGNMWSPETLTVAAVADCFAMTFRAVANASKLKWTTLVCDAKGTIDRVDGMTRFIAVQLHARLALPFGGDLEKGHRALEKAEKACLVGNSLKCQPTLDAEVTVEERVLAPSA